VSEQGCSKKFLEVGFGFFLKNFKKIKFFPKEAGGLTPKIHPGYACLWAKCFK